MNIEKIEELKQHIDLVAQEIYNSTGARVMAAATCIAEGVDDAPDDLYEHVLALIGYDATFEGYFDRERYLTEPKEGELCFGHGIPFNAFEAYIALHDHFGEDWLALSLKAWQPDDEVDIAVLIETAKGYAVKAAIAEMTTKAKKFKEVTERLVEDIEGMTRFAA